MTRELAPRVGFEPTACRLTAEMIENLSALSGVAYEKLGAIFLHLVAPTLAPMRVSKTLPKLVANGGRRSEKNGCSSKSDICSLTRRHTKIAGFDDVNSIATAPFKSVFAHETGDLN
jgi:hypothetical protein